MANLISKLFVLTFLFLTFYACKAPKNHQITENEIFEHISYLASDSLKGRLPGTAEASLASEYIRSQLADYGLNPMFDNGFQEFDIVTKCSLGEQNQLIINKDTLILDEDYRPLSFSANQSAEGLLTFAGYGFDLDMDSLQWNDYQNINVEGKWVMILREDPEPDNMTSEFIPFAGDRAKVTLAKDKGAIGVLLVNGLNASKKDTPVELNYDQNLSDAGIPVLSITRKVAKKLLTSPVEIIEKQMITNRTPVTEESDITVEASVDVVQERSTSRNIAFSLKPDTNSDQYIIVGAHYDHLGMGGPGVSSRMPDTIAVHNGADDNASGVAGLIELAGFMADQQAQLMKNIVFVAFDAEEMGLLGSKYFIDSWNSEQEHITAMLNFDMIGRMKHDTIGITVGGTGTALEFDSLMAQYETTFVVNSSPDGYGPSDHAPFYSQGIPVLYFTTGAHGDYHTPLDDVDFIKAGKEKNLLDYASKILLDLASDTDTLSFKSTGGPQKGQKRTRLKVTLGIVPDFSGIVKDGLGIDGVRPGGPAEKGGLQKGDVITGINGETVTNIYDYMFRLSKLKAGTTAIVEIKRNNQKEVKLIQL